MNTLYRQGKELDEDRFDFEMQVVSVKCNVHEIMKNTKHPRAIEIAQLILDSMPEDDDINMKRHLRGIVDKASWLTVDASTPEPDVIHCLSKLNSRSKNVCLTYQRKLNQFDELLQTIVQLRRQTGTAEIPLETKSGFLGLLQRCWFYVRHPVLQIAFLLSLVLSGVTVFTEVTTVLFRLTKRRLSPFSWAYSLDVVSSVRVLLGSLNLFYISVCFFYAYFSVRVPLINTFALYPHHTDVYALAENAINLCRFQFSLFFHYFTLFQLPDEAYGEIALSTVLGRMNTIPLLGTEFNSFIPVLVVLLSLLSLWIHLREMKREGLELSSDVEKEDEDVKVGKEIVDMALRKQGLLASQESERRKRYYYHDISFKSCVCEQTVNGSS
ncbi:hypothetical protein WA538_005614 [Blastocystis sp. DL]